MPVNVLVWCSNPTSKIANIDVFDVRPVHLLTVNDGHYWRKIGWIDGPSPDGPSIWAKMTVALLLHFCRYPFGWRAVPILTVNRDFHIENRWRPSLILTVNTAQLTGTPKSGKCAWIFRAGWRLILRVPVHTWEVTGHLYYWRSPLKLLVGKNLDNAIW